MLISILKNKKDRNVLLAQSFIRHTDEEVTVMTNNAPRLKVRLLQWYRESHFLANVSYVEDQIFDVIRRDVAH